MLILTLYNKMVSCLQTKIIFYIPEYLAELGKYWMFVN